MPITDFQQQSMQAMQMGGQLGSALRNAQMLQEQRQTQQQEQDYLSQLRPMKLEQQQLTNESMQQDNLKKSLVQDAVLLNSMDEEAGKQIIPQLIEKYKDNEPIVAGFTELYKKTGKDYIAANLQALGMLTGKPIGGKKEKGLPAESVAFNDLIKDFTPEQQKTAKLVKAGLKGRAMSNAVLSAIESGNVKNLAQAKAQIKQSEKFAEATAVSRAKTIDKGFESITKIDLGVRNIDKAISALKGGAGVGAIEKYFPSFKAASVELDNIQGMMALDVVGAVSFGALSKGELDLAKAVALPTGLDTPELIDYLNRKKVAQEKLRKYFNAQIQFLDQGGTVAGFLRDQEKKTGLSQETPLQQEQQGTGFSNLWGG